MQRRELSAQGQKMILVPESPQAFRADCPLEVVPNLYPNRRYNVTISSHEFTAQCPATGHPDLYMLTVEYIPDKWIIELKSVKLYTECFRFVGMMVEPLANKILDDFYEAASPHSIGVKIVQAVRGGFQTEVVAQRVSVEDDNRADEPDREDAFGVMS